MAEDPIEPEAKRETSKFNLEERTAAFGEAIIEFAMSINESPAMRPLISQIVRSGTSAGANYCEADDAVSRKEFALKINTCRKECRETKFWLRMIVKADPGLRDPAAILWKEANELHLISPRFAEAPSLILPQPAHQIPNGTLLRHSEIRNSSFSI